MSPIWHNIGWCAEEMTATFKGEFGTLNWKDTSCDGFPFCSWRNSIIPLETWHDQLHFPLSGRRTRLPTFPLSPLPPSIWHAVQWWRRQQPNSQQQSVSVATRKEEFLANEPIPTHACRHRRHVTRIRFEVNEWKVTFWQNWNDSYKSCIPEFKARGDTVPSSMAECRPEREKRTPCPVPAILPVFPYPGDNLPSRRVDRTKRKSAHPSPVAPFGIDSPVYNVTLSISGGRTEVSFHPFSLSVQMVNFSYLLPFVMANDPALLKPVGVVPLLSLSRSQ